MRGDGERKQIRDAVEANGRLKEAWMAHQSLQDRIASSTASHNNQVLRGSQLLLDEILRSTDCVFDIVDAPLAAQRLHVGFAVARAATMVDLQDGIAAGGKKLRLRVKASHRL